MKYCAIHPRPAWVREIAQDRPRPLASPDSCDVTPRAGDIVLKPFIADDTYKQLFRVETWATHDLLDGPFEHVREAMESAFEFGVTARLAVWLDYSDDPGSHDLDAVPLYFSDKAQSESQSVA